MISEKIKNAAEKAMPKEKKLVDKIKAFFEKKSHRLIVSGVAALVFLYPVYELTLTGYGDLTVLIAVPGFIQITATGAFFANINAFSLKKYAVAVSVWSVVLYFVVVSLSVLRGMDPTSPMQVLFPWLARLLVGIPVCATATALAVLLAYFTVVRKKNA